MMYREDDPRTLRVLDCALRSTSRVTRLRAVSMLARVNCADRMRWLEAGCADNDEAVAATACAVLSWVAEPEQPPWPQREDPGFDRIAEPPEQPAPWASTGTLRWQWEYVVEVWRGDGLLIGAYLATTCEEDDEHAKRIAMGQAILANSAGKGDAFDAGTAAAFIVGKRHLSGRTGASDRSGGDSGRGRAV